MFELGYSPQLSISNDHNDVAWVVFMSDVSRGVGGRAPVIPTARLLFTQGTAQYIKHLRCGEDRTVSGQLLISRRPYEGVRRKRALEQELQVAKKEQNLNSRAAESKYINSLYCFTNVANNVFSLVYFSHFYDWAHFQDHGQQSALLALNNYSSSNSND